MIWKTVAAEESVFAGDLASLMVGKSEFAYEESQKSLIMVRDQVT